MARPERVAFGLSLASSSSELVNAGMTSLKSSPQESMASLSYSSWSLSSVSLLLALAFQNSLTKKERDSMHYISSETQATACKQTVTDKGEVVATFIVVHLRQR